MQRFETRFASPIRQMTAQAYAGVQAEGQANADPFLGMPAGQTGALALQPQQATPNVGAMMAGLQMLQQPQAQTPRAALHGGSFGAAPKAPIPAPWNTPVAKPTNLGALLSRRK